MATPDGGIVTAAYAPSQVQINLDGADVTVDEETEYPFRGTAAFTIHTARPASFPFVIRVPVWADGATLTVNGRTRDIPASGCALGFNELKADQAGCDPAKALQVIRRTWKEGDLVSVNFAMPPRVTHWYHDSAVFERGPLVFSLPLDGRWSELKKYAQNSADWQITSSADWSYAVELGECDAKVVEHAVTDVPFDVKNPPAALEIKGRRYPQWTMQENSAGPVPSSPVRSTDPLRSLALVPYGAAKLRITAFPYLEQKSHCPAAASVTGQ